MKNLKKVLALVLVVAMVMGLAITSNAAFKDASSIKHTEAVDVVSAIGVINGFTDGSYKPSDNVTRAQMAKMVTFILNKGTDVGSTYAGANTFTDCKSSWAKGYIAYASKTGIVAGVGNNKFNPDGSVTGAQAAKMLLCALGYDAAVEQYTGSSWAVNVLKDADDANLLDDLDGVDMSAALSRDNAAQMIFNALKANMVEYDSKGTTITINGATIATGASSAKAVTSSKDSNTIADETTGAATASAPDTVQLGEKYFSKLVLSSSGNNLDNYGRPSTKWVYDSKTVGTYDSKTPVLTYNAEVKQKTIFADLGVDGVDNTGKTAKCVIMDSVYTDGKLSTSNYEVNKSDSTVVTGSGNGVTVEVYKTDTTNHYQMVVINKYFAQVSSITKADSATSTGRKVNLTYKNYTAASSAKSYETDSFAKDDYVIVTLSNDSVKSVAAATKVANVAVTAASTSAVTAGGTSYGYAKNYGLSDKTDYTMSGKATYTFYTDGTYAFYNEDYTADNSTYFYVLGCSATAQGDKTVETQYVNVKYIDAAGKTTTCKAAASFDADKNLVPIANGWYTMDTDSDNTGYYVFKSATGNTSSDVTALSKTQPTVATGILANSDTIFVLKTASDTYKVYTGISNVASYTGLTSTKAYAVVKDSYAKVVYIDTTSGTASNTGSDELVYLFDATSSNKGYDSTAKAYFYTYDVVKDGAKTTIKAASANLASAGLVKITVYDSNNFVKTVESVVGADGYATQTNLSKVTATYSSGTLVIDGKAYAVASNVPVYMVDSDDALTVGTAADLEGTVTGNCYIVCKSTTDATVTAIYFDGSIA